MIICFSSRTLSLLPRSLSSLIYQKFGYKQVSTHSPDTRSIPKATHFRHIRLLQILHILLAQSPFTRKPHTLHRLINTLLTPQLSNRIHALLSQTPVTMLTTLFLASSSTCPMTFLSDSVSRPRVMLESRRGAPGRRGLWGTRGIKPTPGVVAVGDHLAF